MVRIEDGKYIVDLPEFGIMDQRVDPENGGVPWPSQARAQQWNDSFTAKAEAAIAAAAAEAANHQPPVITPPSIITVPAYLRRFDLCCTTPKQAALACDPDPVCRGMMDLALSRVNEGIDLHSTSLPRMLGLLVTAGKITQAEADAIRTTPPKPEELFK